MSAAGEAPVRRAVRAGFADGHGRRRRRGGVTQSTSCASAGLPRAEDDAVRAGERRGPRASASSTASSSDRAMTETLRARSTMSTRAEATPLMRQYARIKREHPDAFLFFRLGDFYEMFFDDAVRGAALLGLTLTSRNKQDPEPIPMCGMPWHQRDAYVARLLRLGHKVAICDQLEDPARAKGLIVERGVTEILTRGSVTGEHFLEPAANNFLVALWPDHWRRSAYASPTPRPARCSWRRWRGPMHRTLLARLRVAEWLTPRAGRIAGADSARLAGGARAGSRAPRRRRPLARFDAIGDRSTRAMGRRRARGQVARSRGRAAAAAAALDYLDRVQGGTARQLAPHRALARDDDAALRRRHRAPPRAVPAAARRRAAAHAVAPPDSSPSRHSAARRLRAWLERPLAESRRLIARQLDAVEAWVAHRHGARAFRDALRAFPDLERLAQPHRLRQGDAAGSRRAARRARARCPRSRGARGRGESVARDASARRRRPSSSGGSRARSSTIRRRRRATAA